jgi:threonine/homoserine/homoserine lactone efflux protein
MSAFVVQAANPKALLFFMAILPQFLDPLGSLEVQVALLGVTSIVVEAIVLLGYGLLAARAQRLAARPRFATLTHRLSGGILLAAALGLARQSHAR